MRWVRTILLQSRIGDSIFFGGGLAQRRSSGLQAGNAQPGECVACVGTQVASQTPGAWSRKGRSFGVPTAGRKGALAFPDLPGGKGQASIVFAQSLQPFLHAVPPGTCDLGLPLESTGFLGSHLLRGVWNLGHAKKSGLEERPKGFFTCHQVIVLISPGVWVLLSFRGFSHEAGVLC